MVSCPCCSQSCSTSGEMSSTRPWATFVFTSRPAHSTQTFFASLAHAIVREHTVCSQLHVNEATNSLNCTSVLCDDQIGCSCGSERSMFPFKLLIFPLTRVALSHTFASTNISRGVDDLGRRYPSVDFGGM